MKLNVIRMNRGIEIEQIDDFPAEIKRSFEGSMHIRPGGVYQVNDDELAHLEGSHADLIERVIRRTKNEAKEERRAAINEKRAAEEAEMKEGERIAKEKLADRRAKKEAARAAKAANESESESPALRGINLVNEEEPTE